MQYCYKAELFSAGFNNQMQTAPITKKILDWHWTYEQSDNKVIKVDNSTTYQST